MTARSISRSVSGPFARNIVGRLISDLGFIRNLLFGGGQQGSFYVPKPIIDGNQVLYQDTAGTTPVVDDGDQAGLMLGLSPNGNDATQSTAASKPLYKTDGTLHWAAFDGVDDFLEGDFSQFDAATTPFTLSVAVSSVQVASTDYYLSISQGPAAQDWIGLARNASNFILVSRDSAGTLVSDGGLESDTDPHVISLVSDGAGTIEWFVDSASQGTISAGTGIVVSKMILGAVNNSGSSPSDCDIHGVVLVVGDDDPDNRGRMEDYLADLAGTSL